MELNELARSLEELEKSILRCEASANLFGEQTAMSAR